MATIKIIGKSILGELGFCQNPTKMGKNFITQYGKVRRELPSSKELLMTSMTNSEIIEEAKEAYVPRILFYEKEISSIFAPYDIYMHCKSGKDVLRPAVDFIVSRPEEEVVLTTFSREAPIIAFETPNGFKALGVILRKSLIQYGDYLFRNIQKAMGEEKITATLVTCNWFQYPEGDIPTLVSGLSDKYQMKFRKMVNSEESEECYHRGEIGNHVVALW